MVVLRQIEIKLNVRLLLHEVILITNCLRNCVCAFRNLLVLRRWPSQSVLKQILLDSLKRAILNSILILLYLLLEDVQY